MMTYFIYFGKSCPEDRDSWLEALTSTIKKVQDNRSTFETLRRDEQLKSEIKLGREAPVWVADVRVTMCMICTSEFNLTFRRHHCRACGAVVCKDCLNNKAPLHYLKGKVDKVCDPCFTDLERDFREQLAAWELNKHTADEEKFKREQDEFDCLRNKFQKIRKSGRFAKLIKRPNRLKEVQANDPEAIISGYLTTLKNKKWRKMWFVLKNHVLYFYKASEDKAAISSIVLLGYDIGMPKENIAGVDAKFWFQISHANQDPIVFQVDSEDTKDRWLKAIATVTDLKGADDKNNSNENTECDPSIQQ